MDEFEDTEIPDERLELIFTCCHPALAAEAQVALTLRALGGLETDEIARAFLVSPDTMKRRLSRARAKIKTTGIPFRVPADHLLPERLAVVLAVIYLIFNEGYGGRSDLAGEAIRLGHVLATLMPDEPEVHGLLALMTLHHARRRARFAGGELVRVSDQDRYAVVGGRDRRRPPAPRPRPRAARARAVRHPGGDRLTPARARGRLGGDRDAVRRARAGHRVAGGGAQPRGRGGRVPGPRRGARAGRRARAGRLSVPPLDPGELLHRLGRDEEARAAYSRALELATAEPERRFLARRISELP